MIFRLAVGPFSSNFGDSRGVCGVKRRARFKCLQCKEFDQADYRNRGRQRYCSKAECRQAAKAQSQRRWLGKPENENYFRGPENTRRVREWRKAHPGYWRNKKSAGDEALQEACSAQEAEGKQVAQNRARPALQDAWLMQPAVLVGLISTMTGSALQEDIARSARGFLVRGQDILGLTPALPWPPSYESQTHPLPSAAAARAAPV